LKWNLPSTTGVNDIKFKSTGIESLEIPIKDITKQSDPPDTRYVGTIFSPLQKESAGYKIY